MVRGGLEAGLSLVKLRRGGHADVLLPQQPALRLMDTKSY